ncbi:MAG: hypothetical protein HC787_11090 [Nostocaceae cyanobacterium CSU_2_110]|nr:hypothetical protein [Richelia sp. SM1_7_0]NJN10018.1 hypothetical protein [Richelia sp. RM1_1_1]NJO28232.1 hypothetical protein [Richelia sp. SL_2_1]NJS17180.1 hypothetical protein [Nostocaceae cyanobacterium CSU_2_110]
MILRDFEIFGRRVSEVWTEGIISRLYILDSSNQMTIKILMLGYDAILINWLI